jgi:hypothetical protein
MKKSKIKPNRVVGGYLADSPFFKMTHQEFVEYAGGQLSVALFKGEFKSELYTLIAMAHSRGMMYQLESE